MHDQEINERRRQWLRQDHNNTQPHANAWIYDTALVGKILLLRMADSKADKPKPVPISTVWHPAYVKPIIVHSGRKDGDWVGLEAFEAIHPNTTAKFLEQPWIIIRSDATLRGRYCKAEKYFLESKTFTVHLLEYDEGRLLDGKATAKNVRKEDLNIAWVDPRFKEHMKALKFYTPKRQAVDIWSQQVDLMGKIPQ
jgi:hypothetical protein